MAPFLPSVCSMRSWGGADYRFFHVERWGVSDDEIVGEGMEAEDSGVLATMIVADCSLSFVDGKLDELVDDNGVIYAYVKNDHLTYHICHSWL